MSFSKIPRGFNREKFTSKFLELIENSSLVNSSKFLLRLFSADLEVRSSGVKKCGDPPLIPEAVTFLEEIIGDEEELPKLRWMAEESVALIGLAGKSETGNSLQERADALTKLGELNSLRALARLPSF